MPTKQVPCPFCVPPRMFYPKGLGTHVRFLHADAIISRDRPTPLRSHNLDEWRDGYRVGFRDATFLKVA